MLVVLVAAVVTLGSGFPAYAASSLTIVRQSVIAGETISVKGNTGVRVARPVILELKSGTSWVKMFSSKSTSSGAFAFAFKATGSPGKQRTLRVRAPKVTIGGRVYLEIRTGSRTVTIVGQSSTVSVPTTAGASRAFSVSGKFSPSRSGRPVAVQKWAGSAWVTVQTLKQDSWGNVRTSLRFDQAGAYKLRLVALSFAGAPPYASPTRVVTVEASPWDQLSARDTSTCGLKENQTLWCWGYNASGQLGNATNFGTFNANPTPVRVGTALDWTQVTVGGSHACGLRAGGTAWCWGSNANGRLGTGGGNRFGPAQVGTATDWSDLVAGGAHTCGLRAGSVWCWGQNSFGQIGTAVDNAPNPNPTPAQVGSESDWTQLAAGGYHTCAIKASGTLWCWGSNEFGQIASATTNTQRHPIPNQVGDSADWVQVAAGENFTCGRRSTGTLWCWGENSSGQLASAAGMGTNQPTTAPLQIGSSSDWADVDAGVAHACAVKLDGTTWCWGFAEYGQLGDGAAVGSPPNSTVGAANGDNDWAAVTSGYGHTCGLKLDGSGWCWGDNQGGQLGTGSSGPATASLSRVVN